MTRLLPRLTDEAANPETPADQESGFGALRTPRGVLPLKRMDVRARIDGLLARVTVRQTFVNALEEPLEATYIFPLPDRAAVSRFRMEVAGRLIEGVLQERAQARREYEEAIEAGHRASIAEEERPGVFTLRVGNVMPGEEATVELELTGPLPFAGGEATFRFPLVVAPRYIPGTPLPGAQVGSGVEPDTDAVPDASRITPPVLLPGFPNPVALSLSVEVHDALVAPETIRSSLHAVVDDAGDGYRRVSLQPGERLDRDFILRFRLGAGPIGAALLVSPDAEGDAAEGTFALTIVPPAPSSPTPTDSTGRRDVVFVIDRSGSMSGWKMVAARRALCRMVDTLGPDDRFTVLAFDDRIETPAGFPEAGLVAATDRQRFRAIEFLAALDARSGTEMAGPLMRAADILAAGAPPRDRVLVLVTDGQVGNEDQILRALKRKGQGVRTFALGIDRAVNEAFLRRLADLGGQGQGQGQGGCEVVESEERLDEVMDSVHRRIGTPVLIGLRLDGDDLPLAPGALVPERFPDLFATAPVLVLGRYAGTFPAGITLTGTTGSGAAWSQTVAATRRENPAIRLAWARGQLRKLEDRYVAGEGDLRALEQTIVATSLRFGVLCRFTAYVAVDRSEVVNPGGHVHAITQPVELPEGWEPPGAMAAGPPMAALFVPKTRSFRQRPCVSSSEPCLAPPPPFDEDGSVSSYLALPPEAPPVQDEAPELSSSMLRRGRLVLARLQKAQTAKAADLAAALRALLPVLEAWLDDLPAPAGTEPGVVGLRERIDTLTDLLNQPGPPAVALAEAAATVAAALEAIVAGAGPRGRRPGRPPFWK